MAALGLTGQPETIAGALSGGEDAGIEAGGWPQWCDSPSSLTARRVIGTAALDRYASVMGLTPLPRPEGMLLGVQDAAPGADWRPDPAQDRLLAEIAALILDAPATMPPAQLRARLPMIGIWANSRIRARSGPISGGELVAPHGPEDLHIAARRTVYSGYFSVESLKLSHRRHDGGVTPVVTREGFIMGDAVVVLPWDPVRDRVLVIDQFRLAPALRHDPQPWLLEAVAGRVDAGESPEEAARREALEEADLLLDRLFPAVHHYPSPGAVTEFLYLYIGIADLPDDATGVHGLDSEAEDIRGHLLDRQALMRMVMAGEISNGPLAMSALWLESQKDHLRAELSGS